MLDYITIQSCTIAYLIWLLFCIHMYHRLYPEMKSWYEKLANALLASIETPMLFSAISLVLWFVYNAVIGNFN